MLVMPIRRIGFQVAMVSRAIASGERIFEILDAKSDVEDAPDAQPLPPIEGRVAFERVTFRYTGLETVLKDVTFEAKPGHVAPPETRAPGGVCLGSRRPSTVRTRARSSGREPRGVRNPARRAGSA